MQFPAASIVPKARGGTSFSKPQRSSNVLSARKRMRGRAISAMVRRKLTTLSSTDRVA